MAKIRNTRPKDSSGNYERIFGNKTLGKLMTKVQSAVIQAGNELEDVVQEHATHRIEDLDHFLKSIKPDNLDKTILVPKKAIQASKILKPLTSEPDMLILCHQDRKKICYVVELKDGFQFDTKKARGEYDSINQFINDHQEKLARFGYKTQAAFCAFNEQNPTVIVTGFKNIIQPEQVMTGLRLCELLGMDYEAITKERQKDCEDNVQYFIEHLTDDPDLRARFEKAIQQGPDPARVHGPLFRKDQETQENKPKGIKP